MWDLLLRKFTYSYNCAHIVIWWRQYAIQHSWQEVRLVQSFTMVKNCELMWSCLTWDVYMESLWGCYIKKKRAAAMVYNASLQMTLLYWLESVKTWAMLWMMIILCKFLFQVGIIVNNYFRSGKGKYPQRCLNKQFIEYWMQKLTNIYEHPIDSRLWRSLKLHGKGKKVVETLPSANELQQKII